jgi:hypothetical protein
MMTLDPLDRPPPPPQRSRRGLFGILLAGLVLGCLFLVAAGLAVMTAAGDSGDDVTPAERAAAVAADPVTVHVSLVGGPTSADVTLSVNGETSQFTADVPMVQEAGGDEGLDVQAEPGSWVYVSAQMREAGDDLECWLSIGGRTIAHGTSAVDYGIVTCEATVPAA